MSSEIVGCGVASVGKGCRPHNNSRNYRDEPYGTGGRVTTIKTFCTICGGWIGNRPAKPKGAK